LYNAFGSKENVIASAVREYLVEFNERTTYSFDEATIDGQLERIVKIQSENMRVAAYTKAIVAVFNSPIGDKFIRSAIRDLCEAGARAFVEAIEQSNGLAKGVTAAWLSQFLVTTTFAVTTDWCAEEISDDQFLDRAAETFLMVVASSTKGKTNTHARRWLEDLRENRASWVSLRKLAEVTPAQPLNAAAAAPARRARSRRGVEDAQALVSAG
jgi:TetR/AcrR family transcriptional regulator, cholesterol catabolism regulator